MIPVFGNDWKVWARQLTTALNSMPLILRAKTTDASAAEDGALVWDRTAQEVQVSRAGAFVPVGPVANDSVTNAKLANMATGTIKGRATAGTGDPEDLTAAQAKALLGVPNAWAERRLTATVTLTNDTTMQNWFGSTATSCALDANSTYEFEGLFMSINGTTSHGLNMEFAAVSGATIRWASIGSKANFTTQATAFRHVMTDTFNTARNVTTASAVGGNVVRVQGVIITTTAGSLQPRVAQTAASGSFVVQIGTFFKVRRVGANTLTNTGEWS